MIIINKTLDLNKIRNLKRKDKLSSVSYLILSSKQIGFTLIEVMIVVAISGILFALALPSFDHLLKDNKMTSLHNELLSSLTLARNTAINKGVFATLCKANSSASDCDSSASWKDGWIVFPDSNNNGAVDSGETIIAINNALPSGVSISFNHNRITYGSQGYAQGYSGTFTFCDDKNRIEKKGMVISSNGRIRVATSSSELASCPN